MLELQLNGQPLGPMAQIAEWHEVELSCVPPAGAALMLTLQGVVLAPFLQPGDPAWRWRWNPQNTVGRVALTLQATGPTGSATLHATLEVVPGKLDQERYRLLLGDIRQVAGALAMRLTQSTAGGAPDQAAAPGTRWRPEEHAAFCAARIEQLEKLVAQIARHPDSALRQQRAAIPLDQVRDPASLDAARLDAAPTDTSAAGLPARVVQVASSPTTDTPANRLLKHVLGAFWRRAHQVALLAADPADLANPSTQTLAARGAALARRLQALRTLPFLADVGVAGPSDLRPGHLVRRDPRYQRVYQLWQELRRAPTLGVASPLFDLPIQALPRLYEYWCVLQVAEALLDLPGATLQAQRLVSDSPELVELVEDAPLLVLTWRGRRVCLRYQPRYRPLPDAPGDPQVPGSLDRHTHIPDIALELAPLERQGTPALLVCDAKYRLTTSGGVPADALADAYTYLGSIGLPGGLHAVRASLLLYPGQGAAEYYASGVGLLPLLPGQTDGLRVWLWGAMNGER